MKDINLINYLNKHNIDVPEYMSVSTVSLPSFVNKSENLTGSIEVGKYADWLSSIRISLKLKVLKSLKPMYY